MKTNILLLIIAIPLVLILAYFTLPWIAIAIGISVGPNPPTPVNTYGEFPFRLVYEVGGEQVTVEDVLVCEFVGKDSNEARGKFLKWDERLESGNKLGYGAISILFGVTVGRGFGSSIKLLDDVDTGSGYLSDILLDIGSAQYYLGYYVLDEYSPGIVFSSGTGIIDEDVLWEQYEIKIIEANFSQPMVGNGIEMKK